MFSFFTGQTVLVQLCLFPGVQGFPGGPGATGFSGAPGVPGIVGVTGFPGPPGALGFTGPSGLRGSQGLNPFTHFIFIILFYYLNRKFNSEGTIYMLEKSRKIIEN